MTGEGKEQEKKKPRKEKARVSEGGELIEKRKGSLDESLTEPRICALELLIAKVKRQISSKNYLYLPSKVTACIFPPIKVKKSPPLDHHRAIERGKHKVARI